LPDYMVPSHLLFLDALPLSPNGKLDRKALPLPDARQHQQQYVAPQTAPEQQVAVIWAEVLKVDRVGLTDNFFESGGHSLLATQVMSRVRQTLNVELGLRVLFEAPVLSEFVARVVAASAGQASVIERVARDQPLPLSFAQQRLWFLWQLEPDSAAYNIPVALRLSGVLDREALRRSFDALVARHETLRTTLRQDGEQAVQIIHSIQTVPIAVEVLEPQADIRAHVEAEIHQPFDLVNGPLLRVRLLRVTEDDHVLVLTMHHIVSDGWSMPVMVEELVSLYEGYRDGQTISLPELPVQYADYAVWQRQWMEAGEQQRQLAYWQEQLGGEQPVLALPLDRPRPSMQSHAGASLELALDTGLLTALKQVAQQQGVTLFMVMLASFQALLHRYSGQADIRVGVANANRNRMETERLIGFFVNTQVLKADFAPHTTFNALLQQVKGAALGAQAHQDLPFEQLVEALQVERSLSHSPLFQVMLNYQSETQGTARSLPGLEVQRLEWQERTAKFDLTLDLFEGQDQVSASLIYATALFDVATIERLGRHWQQLLAQMVHQPQRPIAELPLLDTAEQQRMLVQWNDTAEHYPLHASVQQLIEAQVARTPEAPALTFG
ncbi:condensation domain-containing protein, partial [Pseudomonas sp. 21LCFQ02]|uniref:condensation domain-containing protein n=1 Tax=Pseudomonas sp. 21LCFQ02 TaxID=2957505 RepID=UPI00209B3AD3